MLVLGGNSLGPPEILAVGIDPSLVIPGVEAAVWRVLRVYRLVIAMVMVIFSL